MLWADQGAPPACSAQLPTRLWGAWYNLKGQTPGGRAQNSPLEPALQGGLQHAQVREPGGCALLHLHPQDATVSLVTRSVGMYAGVAGTTSKAVCGMRPEGWPLEGKAGRRAAGALWGRLKRARCPAGGAHGGEPCRHPDIRQGCREHCAGSDRSRSRRHRAALLRTECMPGQVQEPQCAPKTSRSHGWKPCGRSP